MTSFEIIKKPIRSAKMNGTSSVPPIGGYARGHMSGYTGLPEREGLFVGYGEVKTAFPYKHQDMYTRELYDTEIETVVLENEYLRAEFYPSLGGKLASLIDKEKGRDLLFCNPVIRPCNLATRNAWMSGGVEWNCGIFGHHVHTCDPMFVAKTELEDGTPVLRMYEYERIRRAVVQMDFFLPEGSRLLFARMRITNTTPEVIPMYWWSNIAVREDPDGRVITMSDGAYVADGGVSIAPIPFHNGNEVSYPVNIPTSIDYFYRIPDKARKFECYLGNDGYGFVQCSTSRQKGRKLFVWGQGNGGKRWQEYLTEDDDGRYVELQAGLANSQYESLPMPPCTTWEWLEGYGAMTGDPEKIHGEWKGAQAEALRTLNDVITEDAMEGILEATYGMAVTPASDVLMSGSGWAALENMRRSKVGERLMTPHLDFGEIGPEQEDWLCLMESDCMPEKDPADEMTSFMLQPEWTKMLENASSGSDRYNWYTRLQLGLVYYVSERMEDAKREIEASIRLCPSPWAVYAMAHVALSEGRPREGAILAIKAAQMRPDDVSIAKEATAYAVQLDMFRNFTDYAATLTDEVKKCGRIKLNMLFAYVKMGKIKEAEDILYDEGGMVIPDIREGENLVTEMYLRIEEMKAKNEGREFDRNTAEVPEIFDYRMGVPRKGPAGSGRAAEAQKRARAAECAK